MKYWSFELFCFVKKSLYIFENLLNGVHFNTKFLRRKCTGRFENEGGNRQKCFYSNVIVMSYIKYLFFSVISYNGDIEY